MQNLTVLLPNMTGANIQSAMLMLAKLKGTV